MRSIVGGAARAAPPQVQPRLDLQAAAGCTWTELLIQDHKQKTEEYSSDGETDTVTNIVWPMRNDSVSVQFFCCGLWQELISKKCFSRQWDFRLEVFPNPQWTCCQCWRKPPKCLNSETLHLGGKIILASYTAVTSHARDDLGMFLHCASET